MDEIIDGMGRDKASAQRRATWRRKIMHRHRNMRLDTNQLESVLAQKAETRRRVAICDFLLRAGVPNTEKSHREAIEKLWAGVEHRFGPAPDPVELVVWRDLLRTGNARLQLPIVRRRNGGAL